ncbi:hypothetical protein HYALB_00012565 [Hymenoscyphus albidus]|uniref:Uncharacterized protein n=1 Tax=Hymenoscyphus albidus TaxID=595503 RepID=A0A9N9Q9I5_9HELO|nr:hypothetical protein HYALB_00012565 [Hymenoscyphus albidus]
MVTQQPKLFDVLKLSVVPEEFGDTSVYVEAMDVDQIGILLVPMDDKADGGWCDVSHLMDTLKNACFEPILEERVAVLEKLAGSVNETDHHKLHIVLEAKFSRKCDIIDGYTENLPMLLGRVLEVLEKANGKAMAGRGRWPILPVSWYTGKPSPDLSVQITDIRKYLFHILEFQSKIGYNLREYSHLLRSNLGTMCHVNLVEDRPEFQAVEAPSTPSQVRLSEVLSSLG